MPLSSQLARGLAPAGRRLLGMGAPQQRGGLLGAMYAARHLAATATAAAVSNRERRRVVCVGRHGTDCIALHASHVCVFGMGGWARWWGGQTGGHCLVAFVRLNFQPAC